MSAFQGSRKSVQTLEASLQQQEIAKHLREVNRETDRGEDLASL